MGMTEGFIEILRNYTDSKGNKVYNSKIWFGEE